jgi:hypothetical protein
MQRIQALFEHFSLREVIGGNKRALVLTITP